MINAALPSNAYPTTPDHLLYLARNMRVEEQEQWKVMTGHAVYLPDEAARQMINLTADCQNAITIIGRDGYPAIAGGFDLIAPGVWRSWMLGTTEGWAKEWRAITKASRWLAQCLFDAGAHRLEIECLTMRSAALKWFDKGLGFKPEGVKRCYGANGQDVALYARLKGE